MKLLLVCVLFVAVSGRSNFYINCPGNQQWVNGRCREVWRYEYVTAAPSNVVTVPANCPPGQEYINGQCRDVWFRNLFTIFVVQNSNPTNEVSQDELFGRSIVTVPNQCPEGYRPDALGNCRKVADLAGCKNYLRIQ